MEPTIKQVMESQVYQIQKAIIQREINKKEDPDNPYFPDYKIFKKSDEEKGKLATLRAKWLKNMKAWYPDFTKRAGGKAKYRTFKTLPDGENI